MSHLVFLVALQPQARTMFKSSALFDKVQYSVEVSYFTVMWIPGAEGKNKYKINKYNPNQAESPNVTSVHLDNRVVKPQVFIKR